MNNLQTALMALGFKPPVQQPVRHTVPVTTYTEDGRLEVRYRVQSEYDMLRRNVQRTNNSRKLQYCL